MRKKKFETPRFVDPVIRNNCPKLWRGECDAALLAARMYDVLDPAVWRDIASVRVF